jgi:hypothetical protein
MLQPKKPISKDLDKFLKSKFKKELDNQKKDELNQFKPDYVPASNKYKKQLQERKDNTPQLKQDNSTEKDKEFNKNYHNQKEWDAKKWGIYENIATTAELGNFVPHPAAQAVGKVGSIASAALSARKAKLAYDNEDYVNMGLNLGMMGLSGKIGSTTFAKNTVKGKNLDSFEKLISPKEFKSNMINGIEIGRMETKVPPYINVLNKKSGQNTLDLAKNRVLLGVAGTDYLTDFNTKEEQNTQNAMGGNINTNMNRYAQGGDLTQFNEGGLHSQNPLGGVPIGNNNSVEQGETKQNNFVYSNRIFLDSNIVSQYNLPKSLVGKSVADATKFIDNKFKGRNDKISQSTKDSMLSKIAEAQEAMKPQEPEMEQSSEGMIDPSQMALGGYVKPFNYGGSTSTPQYDQYGNVIPPTTIDALQIGLSDFSSTLKAQSNSEDSEDPDSETKNKVTDYLQAGVTAIDLGKTAFGKPAQDTSGLAPSAKVNSGGMIAGSAMKGASAGMAFGPAGVGIGAVVGAGAGLLGAGKAKKAAIKNSNNFAINTNRQFSDQYALGGKMDPPVKSNSILPLRPDERELSMEKYKQLRANAISRPSISDYKPDLRTPEQAMMDYQYLRDSAKPGFNVDSGYRPNLTDPVTAQLLYNKRRGNTFAMGGNVNKMDDGGPFDPNYYENLKLTPRNTAPIESLGLKSVGTTVPYTIGTQPTVDISNANRIATPGPSNLDVLKYNANKVGNYINDNAGNIARYAPIAANAYQLAKLKKPQAERLERLGNRYKPSYVDMAQQQNIVNQELNNVNSAIQASGASQGAIRNAMLGSQLNKTKALSNAYMNAEAQNRQQDAIAQQFNLGVDQTNLQQSNTEKENFARDQAAYRNAKREYITGIGEGIGDIGKEQVQKKIIAKTTGYRWDGTYVKDTTGNIVTDPTTGKPMTEEKLKEIQSIKDKKELGGYLIKNKVK